MNETLYKLLRDCTVRIETPTDRGTGFFVTPGQILTCAHVVGAALPQDIQIYWGEQVLVPTEMRSLQWKDQKYSGAMLRVEWEAEEHLDQAMLMVEITNHPCVYLEGEVLPGDHLYSYGYPDAREKRNGDSITPEYAGPANDEQMLTIKDDNIRPGFSGAPLLNQRTLKVCGLIKSERSVAIHANILRALGGRAVPVPIILSQWTGLEQQNLEFHQRDQRWQTALSQKLQVQPSNFLDIDPADSLMIQALKQQHNALSEQMNAVADELTFADQIRAVQLERQRDSLSRRMKRIEQQLRELGDG